MIASKFPHNRVLPAMASAIAAMAMFSPLSATVASAQNVAIPGNLVVSLSSYTGNSAVKVGQTLPPGCATTTAGCSGTAIAGSNYPQIFNNDSVDGSFGITSKIYLYEVTLYGAVVNAIEVPNSGDPGVTSTTDQLVTSFSSKSELGLHLSLDKKYLTFMGYVAPLNTLDVSNANTPGVVDPTNPVGEKFYRAAIAVDKSGRYTVTETNAYSGNNPRSTILNNVNGANVFYTAGNAGNGSAPQPNGIILGAGAQILTQSTQSESQQSPGTPTPAGSFNITELGDKADKIGKDDNFRGMTVFNNVIYYTKGSGGNGVNTVYFLDTTGTACPNGVGLPAANAALPTTPLSYNPATLQSSGLPSNMCILSGFPSTPNKTATVTAYPFGIWFANATTLYVADEGDGYNGGADLYTHAAAQTTAGLQKWIFDSGSQTWKLAYTLNSGLNLGLPYNISAYPTGTNSVTNLPWSPATDGLRNITGLVGDGSIPGLPKGYIAVWGITSTVSGSGDQGADPNKLMVVIDRLANTSAAVAAKEQFYTVDYAASGAVLRGVNFTPGTTNIASF